MKNRSGQSKKYGNVRCEADGYKFDSLDERERYFELKNDSGVSQLAVKPAFLLRVNGVDIFSRPFHPDFSYYPIGCETDLKLIVVEDVKGYLDSGDAATKLYEVKKRLVKAIYGINIKTYQTEKTKRAQERRLAKKSEQGKLKRLVKKTISRTPTKL